MLRFFLAITIPDDVRSSVFDFQQILKTYFGKRALVTWVKQDAMHIMVNFFGSCTDEQHRSLVSRIRSTIAPFSETLTIDKLVAFPDIKQPRVISATCVMEGLVLSGYQRTIEEIAADLDIPPAAYAWIPHMTIGRVHGPLQKPWPKISVPSLSFQVKSLTLFSSELTPRGPVYTPIETFPKT